MSSDQSDEFMSVIAEVFSTADISPDSTFNDLEANSVKLLQLIVALKSKFDVDIDVVDMFTVGTVGDLALLVKDRVPQTRFPSA